MVLLALHFPFHTQSICSTQCSPTACRRLVFVQGRLLLQIQMQKQIDEQRERRLKYVFEDARMQGARDSGVSTLATCPPINTYAVAGCDKWVEHQNWHHVYRMAWIEAMERRLVQHWQERGWYDATAPEGRPKGFRKWLEELNLSHDPRISRYVDRATVKEWKRMYKATYNEIAIRRQRELAEVKRKRSTSTVKW